MITDHFDEELHERIKQIKRAFEEEGQKKYRALIDQEKRIRLYSHKKTLISLGLKE